MTLGQIANVLQAHGELGEALRIHGRMYCRSSSGFCQRGIYSSAAPISESLTYGGTRREIKKKRWNS